MAGQAGSDEQQRKDPQGADAAGAFTRQIDTLRESKREIGIILKVLEEARFTLDLLEQNTVDIPIPDLFEPDENKHQRETIRLAAYLYSMALESRNKVKDERFNKFLQTVNYNLANTELLLTTFDSLADAWSTYKKVIDCLDIAAWDREPSPDRIWAALEAPRRKYILKLSAYYVQLSLLLNKLDPDTEATSSVRTG